MARIGRWLGAGLGFISGAGIFGALLGYFIGGAVDDIIGGTHIKTGSQTKNDSFGETEKVSGFMFILSVLSTAVMKADGKITKSELDFVKHEFLRTFGEEATLDILHVIKTLKDKDIPLHEVCTEIRYKIPESERIQLLYFMVGIAKADGNVSISEIKIISQIAREIGISAREFESISSMFGGTSSTSDYTIMGITKDATNSEVKKAYKKMAMENHPDKVSHLGDDIRKAAEEKFTKINVAYDRICKQRGIK